MSIFDKFKKKEEKKAEPKKSVAAAKSEKKAKEEVAKQTVVTPDGRLVETAKKVEAKPKKAKAKKEETGDAYRVLLQPLITEKSSMLGISNQYVFAVAKTANKIEIRKAIRKVYGIDPIKVNVINVGGKEIRYGKTQGRTRNWKKAIITLAQGQKIEIQEGL